MESLEKLPAICGIRVRTGLLDSACPERREEVKDRALQRSGDEGQPGNSGQTLPEGGSPETGKCAGKRLTAQEGGSGCQTSWTPAPLSPSTSIPDMQEFMAEGRVHAENYGSITASYLSFFLPLN